MCYMIAIPIAMAAASAASSYMGSEQQRAGQKYQAAVAAGNASAMREQANLTRQKGAIAQTAIDRERDELHRGYEDAAGANRSMLAASNVDLTSGSASDLLTGNANLFADDVAVNRYNRAMVGWNAEETAKQQDWQGDVYDSQASYLKKTSGSLGMSLLTAGMKGAMTFMAAYGAMGLGAGAGSTPFSGPGFTGNVGDATGTGGGYLMPGGGVSGL